MIKAYINQKRTASKFQSAIKTFQDYGVLEENISISTSLEDVAKTLGNGDSLVVMSYTEICTSLGDLYSKIISLAKMGVTLRSIEEPDIAISIDQINMVRSLSELDTNLRAIRTKQGLCKAKEKGVKLGRPKGSTKANKKVEEVLRLRKELSVTIAKACQIAGCQPRTYYRNLKKMNQK